jgi:predicted Zn-ribbon and HTH transcriptional regulator
MALRDTDYDMISAAMAERLARAVAPVMAECARCGFPCIDKHLDSRGICPDCSSGENE